MTLTSLGTYDIENNRLIIKTNDGMHTLVFDISNTNPKFIASESTKLRIEDGTEFERTSEIAPVPTSVFYDVGGDGRYEYVHLSKTELNGEFALRFNIFARGASFDPITVPFEKYDYIELIKREDRDELMLNCYNKHLPHKNTYYAVEFKENTVIITQK